MQKNQFFYTINEDEKGVVMGSFNIEKVIRTGNYDTNKLMVLLDDFHEMIVERPSKNPKSGKVTISRQKEVVCSEIYLNEQDSERFKDLFEIDYPDEVEESVK